MPLTTNQLMAISEGHCEGSAGLRGFCRSPTGQLLKKPVLLPRVGFLFMLDVYPTSSYPHCHQLRENLMTDIDLVVPEGMFGAYEGEDALTSFLRELSTKADRFPEFSNWSEKYGIDLNTAVFSMHTYCWCEKEDCPWCGPSCECERYDDDTFTLCERHSYGWGCEYGAIPGYSAPNFWHKPTDFKVWWYKWIGRSMETEGPMPTDWEGLLKECLESIP